MSSKVPHHNWNITSDEIKQYVIDLIKKCTELCDTIAAANDVTFENIVLALNDLDRIYHDGYHFLRILWFLSPHKEIRDRCNSEMSTLNKFQVEMKMRKDVFDNLQKYAQCANLQELDRESRRFIETTLIDGKQNGLLSSEETRERIKELKQRISNLQLEFGKNLIEENSKFIFKKEELDGVNEHLLNSFEKNENGDYILTLRYPVYYPVMKECRVPSTRRKLLIAFESRCVEQNTKLFEEILELRHEFANLCGYKNYAEFALELCMTKTPATVEKFLNNFLSKLKPLLRRELDILLKYKKDECEQLNLPFDGKINQSDLRYYYNVREKAEFNIDHSKLQEYFPFDSVMKGVFEIYQSLLGLKFEVIDAETYHEEVKFYRVTDNETNSVLGYFYTDLHPRDGKFGHAAILTINLGGFDSKGEKHYPVCNMACNFTKSTNDKPALLIHDEVETFFHEFGHVMHLVCSKTKFAKFNHVYADVDFLEAPSQMLENWVWRKESLKLMSGHYKDGSPIDDELLENLIRSKAEMAGQLFLRPFKITKLLYSKIDQIIHQCPKSDTKKLYQECLKDVLLMDSEDSNMNGVASFPHLTAGYEGKLYSYLWSEVISQDMFDSRFKKEGILNTKTGMDYRRCILEPGFSMDAHEVIVNFIGRDFNDKAFFENKGLKE